MGVTVCDYLQPPKQTVNDRDLGIYTVDFVVITDGIQGPKQTLIEARSAAAPQSIPALWSTYTYPATAPTESDTYAYMRQITRNEPVERMENGGLKYIITCQFRPLDEDKGEQPGDSNTNPVLRPTRYWFDREVYNRLLLRDRDGKDIVNKVGSPYEDPLEHEATRAVLVAEWNVATLAEVVTLNRNHENTVNSSTWNTIPAEAGLCREISSGPQQNEGGQNFYHVVARIAIADEANGDSWHDDLLEVGNKHFVRDDDPDPNDGQPGPFKMIQDPSHPNDPNKKIKETVKVVGNEPRKLADDGTLLDDDLPGIFTQWKTRPISDFSDFDNP